MLKAAVKRRLIAYSPAEGVELESPEHHDITVWGPAEVAAFLACTEEHEPRLLVAYRLALSYGLRRGELAGLRWQDIDTDAGLLHVRQNLVSVGGELALGPPKTRAGLRSLPLAIDPGFGAALREHRKRQMADRMAAGTWTETELVLATATGEPVQPWVLSCRFTELAARAGLPKLTLHGARHTANSAWAQAGVGTSVRQAWMGHSSPLMTDVNYLHLRREAHDQGAALAAAYTASSGLR
jgi:integrase